MTALRKDTDVVVVGAGVIGCAVARQLALAGLSVAVVDGGRPASEASWAAAGMLSPLGEADAPGPFQELALRSIAMWPDWLRGVEEDSGQKVEYRSAGKLILALDEAEAERLRGRLRLGAAQRASAEWVDAAAVAALEPAATPAAAGGLLLPGAAWVDNRALGEALWRAATAAGCRFDLGEPVARLEVAGGAVRGVVLRGGGRLPAERVVLAAGAWSGGVEGLPRPLPVRPIKGQMLALASPPQPLRVMIQGAGVYLVPRGTGAGRVLVGATVEEAGFDRTTTEEGLRGLLDAAVRLVPALGESTLLETWAGLRPGTADAFPVLGREPRVDGLLYATGHFRNGILLAPVTAEILGAALRGEDAVPAAFQPARFG